LVARRSDVWLRAFIDYMRDHARTRAAAVLEILDLSGVARVLDVGGGPAVYATAFARAKDDLRVTVFDHPAVVPRTRKTVSEAGLEDRIDAIAGDFRRDELGDGYDLVLISETAHAVSGPDNKALVRKAYEALNPGGRLVIQDFILSDDRTGPLFATLFSLDMLMGREGADTYSEAEVRDWMSSAGFSEIEQVDTTFGTTLVIGHKATT
jgi:ubiquinone/menaquinone biosynthesis C-methylase UbiE